MDVRVPVHMAGLGCVCVHAYGAEIKSHALGASLYTQVHCVFAEWPWDRDSFLLWA